MFLFSSALPLPFDTAVAFLAGGAVGIAMMRVARLEHAVPTLSLVDDNGDAPTATALPPGDSMHWSDAAVLERPTLATRTRTGHLPLPNCVTALTPTDVPGLALVNVFVDRLAELPYQAWLAIGRAQLTAAARVAPRATPFAILEATIATQGLGFAAWYARDAVETSAFLATNGASQCSPGGRRVIARAHGAAEAAALALLARDALAPTDFATLYAPFEHVLSSDEMPRLAASRPLEGGTS